MGRIVILMIRYLNKAKCIINQYTNYTFPQLDNLHLNGINTQVTVQRISNLHLNIFLTRGRISLITEVSRRPTEPTVSYTEVILTSLTWCPPV